MDRAAFSELLAAARRRIGAGEAPEGLAAAMALERGAATEDLIRELSRLERVAIDLDPPWAQSIEQLEPLPLALCRRIPCVGVRDGTGEPAVLVDDPWAMGEIRQIVSAWGGMPRIVWSTRARIFKRLNSLASSDQAGAQPASGEGDGRSAKSEPELEEGEEVRVISIETLQGIGNPVVRFVDQHVLQAWQSAASDIHFEMGRRHMHVKYRIDGVLLNAPRVPGTEPPGEAVINRIKVLARLDISETRIPQDGRFRAGVGGRGVDFRVSVMPSIFGEDAVVRLLDKAQLRSNDDRIDLTRLGFDEPSLARLRAAALEPHGMILVTGPTGSGKTTTLYALLSQLQRGDEKVITIEDPVEYELSGVLQIPVNEKKGLTFARGLRSILRHDPDKILVGEIRDSETAEIAVQAALTGHLVFTTVHANNVYDVVGRFLHMNVDLYGFVSALNCILAQRLLRMNCPHCALDVHDKEVVRILRSAGFSEGEFRLRAGTGCARCRGTGYGGRSAVAEILPVDDRFRELVVARASGRALREHVASLEVTPLRVAALRLVAQGRTTYDEVARIVGSHG